MLSCDFSTHALYELCIIGGKFVMRLDCDVWGFYVTVVWSVMRTTLSPMYDW